MKIFLLSVCFVLFPVSLVMSQTWEEIFNKEIEYYVKLNHEFGKYYEYRMKPKGTRRVSSKKDEKNS